MFVVGHYFSNGGFDGFAAAAVEVEQVGDLVFWLGAGRDAEAGAAGGLLAYVGVGGDELEQVEGDIFRAAGGAGGWRSAGIPYCDGSGVWVVEANGGE